MTRKNDRMTELQRLTAIILNMAQVELHQLRIKERSLRQNLADLTAQKTRQAQAPRMSDDPALIAGADLRWQHWVDQRRGAINIELAQVIAAMEPCHGRLQRAFGRDQAAKVLAEQAAKDVRYRQSRRD